MMRLPLLIGVALLTSGCSGTPRKAAAAPTTAAAASGLIQPPFVRVWTQRIGDNAIPLHRRGNVGYFGSTKGVFAVDLGSGSRSWTALRGSYAIDGVVCGDELAVLVAGSKRCRIVALNLNTGKERKVGVLPAETRIIGGSGRSVYSLDNNASLQAFNVATGRKLWTSRLQIKSEFRWINGTILASKAGLCVSAGSSGHFGIDPATGKVRWRVPGSGAGHYSPMLAGPDLLIRNGQLARVRMKDGVLLWKAKEIPNNVVLLGNVVVSVDLPNAVGRSLADGKVLWRISVPSEGYYGGFRMSPAVQDDDTAWFYHPQTFCVSKAGKLVWSGKAPFTGQPAFGDSNGAVTVDQFRLLGYRSGSLPALPTGSAEKKALAEKLAATFEDLDNAERALIPKLGPYSYQPLLARYVEWAKRKEDDPDGYENYNLLTDSGTLLLEACGRADTEATVAAIGTLGKDNTWKGMLEHILEKKGDSAAFVPALVASLRRQPKDERETSTALSAVAHSSHPEAVAFMLEALKDPNANPEWRKEAFRHLAGTGGDAGVAAVRAARAQRLARKPWYERFNLAGPDARMILETRKDAKGRTWVLFHSTLLGNGNDVFLAEKTKSGWSRPLFTGVWLGRVFEHEAPKQFRGMPVSRLMKSDWIRLFPDDPIIRRDGDGDGLTNVVEARFGTNPKVADTDGDGLNDSVDPCPNAAPRQMGDAEKVLAAAVEARFFAEPWESPGVIGMEGVKPFELYGYPAPLIWEAGSKSGPLGRVYGGGMNSVGIHTPKEGGKVGDPDIEFSDGGNTARTIISRYSGGLNGDGTEVVLKKIGDEWYVVDMIGRYVS